MGGGISLAPLITQIKVNISGFRNEMEKAKTIGVAKARELSKSFDKAIKIGDKFQGIGDTLIKNVTLPITGAFTAAGKLASDFNESLNKVQVTFGSCSKKVIDWSRTTLNSFGIAQGTALDMASTFGDMGTSMGITNTKAADMSMKMVGLAGDLASFKNISIKRASEALTGVYTGETEALKSLGIVMTQTNLQRFAESHGIHKNIQDMSQSEQVQLRYNYVMAMTKKAHGDFARTANGTANTTRKFTETLKELGAKIGQDILPIVTPLIQKATDLLNVFEKMPAGTQKAIVEFLAFNATIGPIAKILGSSLSIYGKIGKRVTKVGELFIKNEKGISKFGAALTKSKSFAGTFGKGLKMIIDPLNLSGKAMNVTGKGATKFGKVLLKLKTPIKAVGSHLSFLKVPFTMTGKLFGKFGALAGKTGGKVVQVFGKMASLVPGPVQKMGGLVAKSMGKLGGTVVGKMGKIAGSMIGGFARCGASLVGFLGPVGVVIAIVGLLALAFATNFGGCRNTVKNVMTSIKSIISSVTAIIQVIWSNWGIYIKTFALAIWNNIQVIFSTALKVIADVFKVFASLFKGDWQGAWNAVKDIFSSIWHMIGSLLKNFLNIVIMIIVGIGGKLLNAARTAFMGIMHGFKYVWAAITGWLSGAVHHPVDTIRGIGSALYSAGCSIFNSLWDGIKSVWSGITSWVSDKISWLKSKVEFWKSSNDSMKKTDGSHYNGLSYVPWDGYVARLHKGERILTADENSAYTHGGKGNGGINVQNNFYGRVDSPYEVYKATRKSMRDWQFA